MKRPNVLILYTDQQRWDTIAAAGYGHMITPNLDRLAARGALFHNAFCNNPVCMPSRQSMLSGQYPSAIGCTTNGIEMSEETVTLHKVIKPYGYTTANIGKLHFRNHANRDHREPHPTYGFDHLILSDEPGCYDDAYIKWVEAHNPQEVENCRCSTPPAWRGKQVDKHPRETHEPYLFDGPEELTHSAFVADETIDFIRRHKRDPFFCIAGFYAPHTPLNPPKRFVDLYDGVELPLPQMNPEERERFGLSDEDWLEVRKYYYALISHVDDQVGRILDALDETGQTDDTIVIFTSDHGEHLGDHGRIQKGTPNYDSCVHIPLLIAYPRKIIPGTELQTIVESVDIGPTILDYCGIQIPPIFQGHSMRPALAGSTAGARISAFIEHRVPFGPSWKTVRTHTHKYCVSNDGQELLFDLEADPHELTNVLDHQEQVADLDAMRAEMIRRWFDVESQYPVRTGDY